MHKKLWTILLASSVALAGLAVACGDDDNASSSSSGGVNDGGSNDGNPANNDSGNPDGGCTFAGFVKGLLAQPSNSAPSTDLGDQCTPSTSTDDFQSVFTH